MHRFSIFFLLAGFIFPAACLAEPSVKNNNSAIGSELVLVKNGRPTATIVTSSSPTKNARTAANELQEYIEKISGAKLPIAGDSTSLSGCLVLVGPSKFTDRVPNLNIT